MRYARVLVEVAPAHLDRPFDYRIPAELQDQVAQGSRVEVIFAGRRVRGLVCEVADRTELPADRVRELRRVLGPHVWIRPEELDVLRWAAARYAAPTADVIRHALPARVVDVERRAAEAGWFPPGAANRPPDPEPGTVDETAWRPYGTAGARLRSAVARGSGAFYWRPLPSEDVGARLIELVGLTLSGGRDVLVLVPEPVVRAADALLAAVGALAVDAREGDTRRAYRGWLKARCGQARMVLGGRGTAFWPLERLGLTVVVDEANPAFKERRSPRHHARDVALERARRAGAAALLVGHVPSSVAWRLLAERRLTPVVPTPAAERAAAPIVVVDDRSDPRSRGRLGSPALDALRAAVARGELGIVLAARRGEGRALACSQCGDRLTCPRCHSSLAVPLDDDHDPGLGGHGVICEGCGWQTDRPLTCRHCGAARLVPLAAGAQRLGAELRRSLPATTVAVLQGYAQPAPPAPAVVVMTRGSAQLDPPGTVGAVVLPDFDGFVRRPALDAAEDALRLALRLAAWVARDRSGHGSGGGTARERGGVRVNRPDPAGGGRGARTGEAVVVVQTRDPHHHAVQALVRWDPGGFWRAEVARRAELRFPPAAHAVRVEVDGDGRRVAEDLQSALPPDDEVLGPRPGPRAGLLIKSQDRQETLGALARLRAAWSRDGLEVHVDVDPVDVS